MRKLCFASDIDFIISTACIVQNNSWRVIRFNGLPCHFQERTGACRMVGICIFGVCPIAFVMNVFLKIVYVFIVPQ